MVAFLGWSRSVLFGALTAVARSLVVLVLLLLVLIVFGMLRGDGLPRTMVLTLDLRPGLVDSSSAATLPFAGGNTPTVMDIVLGLDAASRDDRVKGVVMRLGSGSLSIAQADEIADAVARFRASGRFVVAAAQGFNGTGLGDYLAAASANEIWMQPKSPFSPAGAGGGSIFLKGLFDKVQAQPQIAKRAEYKSAADTFMENGMTAPDREQLTEVMRSWVTTATQKAAQLRRVQPAAMAAAFDASPQLTEDAQKRGLVDRIGFDDDAGNAAIARAGSGAAPVAFQRYARARAAANTGGAIALVQASGEINDGKSASGLTGDTSIGGDDLAAAIRQATKDKSIKAILLRVDSPGGSVSASDQILDALRKARRAGKPVIVSMGGVAASGGYYISAYADKIVAHPATLTGSIGVLTGKVSVGKSLNLIGVNAEQVGEGRNALMDSSLSPYTADQWAAVNRQADAIYDDFTRKVAQGRRMPLPQVQAVARGRVWTGADARTQGLVDVLGGFWTAAELTRQAAHLPADAPTGFRLYPRPKGLFATLSALLGGGDGSVSAMMGGMARLSALLDSPVGRVVGTAAVEAGHGGVSLRATGLPVNARDLNRGY